MEMQLVLTSVTIILFTACINLWILLKDLKETVTDLKANFYSMNKEFHGRLSVLEERSLDSNGDR